MKIKTVETKKDLMNFIKFQWKIYKNDPNWVPPLIFDMKNRLDKNKNPFWKHSEQKLFLVIDDNNEILGRIAGVIDKNFIEFHNEKTGFFAFFESVDDNEVAKLLIDTVKEWLKQNGMTKMIGPTAPSTNDEMGLLIEGYDSSPYLMMGHNPKYYNDLLVNCGLTKAKDLFAYHLVSKDLPLERLNKINDAVRKRIPGLMLRKLDTKHFNNEIEYARQIYNQAWEKNWGFVPWTDEEFQFQCANLKDLVIPDLIHLAFINGKPVGMIIAVPNYYEIFKKLNGKLGPIEIIKFLLYRNRIKTLRIMIMGVIKEYRNRGIEGLLYWEVITHGMKLGYNEGELSWILEDNTMMCRAAEMLGGIPYKKYRMYETIL